MTTDYWSDLPDDLLPLVYAKVGGLLHRVRFSAVCKSWQAAAVASRHPAPPALPWLILSSTHRDLYRTRRVYCPEEDEAMRIHLPSENMVGKWFVGAHDGGWIAAVGFDLQLAIVNLFSGVEVEVPLLNQGTMLPVSLVRKVVFSESPTSTGCILAAITYQHEILLWRPGCPGSGWTTKQFHVEGTVERFPDIIFHNGHLYGLNIYGDLLRFETGVNQDGWPMITKQHLQAIEIGSSRMDNDPFYLFNLEGKLAMAVRSERATMFRSDLFFMVFELAHEPVIGHFQKWEEVESLGNYSLFLGKTSSKAVYVPAGGHGKVQRSYIYADDVVGGRSYLMQEDGGDGIKSSESWIVCGPWGETLTWIFPPDFYSLANQKNSNGIQIC
ncbi:hypothetical protein ACQ4PT_012880 [Festuca glaucescens]